MARGVITDPLQSYSFWLFDVSPLETLQLPVFSPLLGFSRITMPELTLEQTEIREGNWFFPRKVTKSASIGTITLERAATFYNSDFWRWMIVTITGDMRGGRWFSGISLLPQTLGGISPRRNLVLVHFLARGLGAVDKRSRRELNTRETGDTGTVGRNIGPFEITTPRIPAKAWILHGCLPIRMKPGSDFDANSSDISLEEIEMSVEAVEEVSLADPL